MKTKQIHLLTITIVGIILFWLVPGINKADDTTYVRRYEDTDASLVSEDTVKRKHSTDSKITKRKYRKETIEPEAGLTKVHPKMFSRAFQFEEVILVEEDSVKEVGNEIARKTK